MQTNFDWPGLIVRKTLRVHVIKLWKEITYLSKVSKSRFIVHDGKTQQSDVTSSRSNTLLLSCSSFFLHLKYILNKVLGPNV